MSNSFKEKPQSNIAEKTKPSRAVLGIITREDGTREVAVNTTAIPGGGADDLFHTARESDPRRH